MRITAGQPPAGGDPAGSNSVAASETPSLILIVTSCLEDVAAGEALPATASERPVAAAAIQPFDTGAKGRRQAAFVESTAWTSARSASSTPVWAASPSCTSVS